MERDYLGSLSKRRAEIVLELITEQFSFWINSHPEGQPPRLQKGYGMGLAKTREWVIVWDDGPEGWAFRAFRGGLHEEAYWQYVRAGLDDELAIRLATQPEVDQPWWVSTHGEYSFVLVLRPRWVPESERYPAREALS